MADSDLINLYSGRILALAADIPNHDRLENPQASIRKRAPLCGSTVTVDLSVEDGKISAFGQEVKACALGQAAASVLGGVALGLSRKQIATGLQQLNAMLNEGGEPPDAPFDGLEVLLPAKEFRNRHGSILLSLEATLEAFDCATEAASA